MFLDMHGLIFYLSISPLAGSTRYLRKWTTSRPKRSARETTGSLGTLTLSPLYEIFALVCTDLFPIAVRAISRSANVIEANSFNWLALLLSVRRIPLTDPLTTCRWGEFLQLTRSALVTEAISFNWLARHFRFRRTSLNEQTTYTRKSLQLTRNTRCEHSSTLFLPNFDPSSRLVNSQNS